MLEGKIIAVCSSRKKGTRKTPVAEVSITRERGGVLGDAHADCASHRQVSLLAIESVEKMRRLGLEVGPGDFAENLTTEGIEIVSMPVGTRLGAGGDVVLEVTQIGKICHTRCAIYRQVGQCIMPEEGVFARVVKGGMVRPGDSLRVLNEGANADQGDHPDPGVQDKSS
ncbi:MAG: MOSC domain-containing protein [Chloroflexi bacterium]|nr:MOSC domain-containing protein [Chloroflexota bacterium]